MAGLDLLVGLPPSLFDQAWQWYLDNVPVEQILLDIRKTPEYKARFPAMDRLQARGRGITEAEYVNYEQQAYAIWHAAGLPVDQIGEGDYITKWLEGDVSIVEVQHRVQDLYVQVAKAPREVRDWYAQEFGASGDAALAASLADPGASVPVLERQVAAAQFGGTGSRFGYQIGVDTALVAAGIGITPDAAQSGFQQVSQLDPLFRETISETDDFTAERQGVGAVFGLDATSEQEIVRRQRARQAATAGSTRAGGLATSRGLGVGTARSNQR